MKLRDLEKLEAEADRALYDELLLSNDLELAGKLGYTPPVPTFFESPYLALLDGTSQQGAAQQKASSWIFSVLNAAGSVMGGIPGVWPRI